MYHDDNNSWPSQNKWKEQIDEYVDHEEVSTNNQGYTDIWGNEIKYVVTKSNDVNEPERYIYSFGPNGKNENGKGDDVVEEVK